MGIREYLNKNPAITIAGMAILVAITLVVILRNAGVWGGPTPETSGTMYFYDEDTRELFTARSDQLAPIAAPSGGSGVLAEVYACGDCSGEKFAGLLQKYTDKGKKAMSDGIPVHPSDNLIRLPKPGSEWVPSGSAQGQKIRAEALRAVRARCDDAKRCLPK